jgi:hypothetical protein
MKSKLLIAVIIIYFLIINTSYFWETHIGVYLILIDFLLFLIFIVLVITLFFQFYDSIRERFKDKSRILISLVLLICLILIAYKPGGIIDFEKFEGKVLLIARYEGVANCTTTLKLKSKGNFTDICICFGIQKAKGLYTLKNDTIWLTDPLNYGNTQRFAVLRKSKSYNKSKYPETLMVYQNQTDTLPMKMNVVFNSLKIKTIK